MTLLAGCPDPEYCSPDSFYGANVHPATLLTESNIAAGCSAVLLVCVVVLVFEFWRDERPAWKRATPIVNAAAALVSALTALNAHLTYAGYRLPGLSPDAPPSDWSNNIGLAAMDGLSLHITLFGMRTVGLMLLTLVFAWSVLLQVLTVSPSMSRLKAVRLFKTRAH